MYMHMYMADEHIGVYRQLPNVVAHLKQYSVTEGYQREKAELIAYADKLLQKTKSLLRED
jgi:hypothetical protein